MACNASFPSSLELTCLQEGIADLKAGNKKAGATKLLYAAGCALQLAPDDKKLVGTAAEETLDLTDIAALESALPEEGNVAAVPWSVLLPLILPVLQKAIIKFIEGLDGTN